MANDIPAGGKVAPAQAKMETTTRIARSIIDDEAAARERKTARLQAARLEREAAEAAQPKPEPKPKPKKPAKAAKPAKRTKASAAS